MIRSTSPERGRKRAVTLIAGLGLALGAALAASQAEARDIRVRCAPGDTSPEIGQLVIEIPRAALDSRLSAGHEGNYEMALFGDLSLRDTDPGRRGWTGPRRCEKSFEWEEFWTERHRFHRTPVGVMSEHRPGLRFIIDNAPRDALVRFRLGGAEQDRHGEDLISFAPGEREGWLDLSISTRDRRARVLARGTTQQTLHFGRTDWVYGGRRGGAGYNGAFKVGLSHRGLRPNPEYAAPPVVDPVPPQNTGLKRRCRKYARRAVGLFEKARALGCGLSGREWSGNENRHFRWCMRRADIGAARARNAGRRGAVDVCRDQQSGGGNAGGGHTGGGGGPVAPDKATCRSYAARAADRAQKAENIDCGFTGDRWATNTKTHYRWCMGRTDRRDLQAEREARGQKFYICSMDQSGGK